MKPNPVCEKNYPKCCPTQFVKKITENVAQPILFAKINTLLLPGEK
jgi:hypothetical protein